MSGWASAISAAVGSMTPAMQVLYRPSGAKSSAPRRRRRKTARKARPTRQKAKKRARTKMARRKSRLVKGSAAAKRYMAKIRRMRKR